MSEIVKEVVWVALTEEAEGSPLDPWFKRLTFYCFLAGITRRNGGRVPDQVIEEPLKKDYKGDKVETFVDRMAALLWDAPDYLARLEETFDRRLTGG